MDNLQNENSPLQGFEALESFISAFRLQDFQDAWERYAGPVAISRDHENSIATS